MANYHSAATMCEVTYDSDWYRDRDEDDRFVTPYRYSLMRNDTDSNSDTVSLTLPSYTYYEYLRSLYDCRSTALHRNPPGYPSYPPGGSEQLPGRARTWHEFGSERSSVQASRQATHSEPTKIRPTYPFPSLHLIQQGATSGDESDEDDFSDRPKEKLVWVDALNKWIPEHHLHPRPYMSFVSNPPVIEKQGFVSVSRESQRRWQSAPSHSRDTVGYVSLAYTKELSTCSITPGGGDGFDYQLCERFEQHMGRAVSQPAETSRQRNSDKREQIRRRAQEIAEQRKQRKAYSTPLYTSLTERKLKARIKSSKAPASTPVSPVPEKPAKAPPPKEVWLAKDQKSHAEGRLVPLKKEISITLHTPKIEEQEASGDTSSQKDKHVKFQQDLLGKDKGKKKKEPTDDENSNNSLAGGSSTAEKELIETLEKQRLQQLAMEQKLIKEQKLEKERLAREKEKQREKERLERERERLLQVEKDPRKHGLMNSHKQPHENYYESTMNAAGYFHEKKSKVRIDTEGSKLDDTATNKTDPTSVLRNKNLNRGILKPKDPIKYTESARPIKDEKKEKNLLNSERMNKVDNKETKDEVERTRLVPGGTNYVPSKDAKKDLNNKPKESINNKVKEKEPKKEREPRKERDPREPENKPLKEKEIVEIKEDSCVDSGSKRRKGKDGPKQKKKLSKDKTTKKKSDEEEDTDKFHPEPIPDPPVIPTEKELDSNLSNHASTDKQNKLKSIQKKTKRGYTRVKGHDRRKPVFGISDQESIQSSTTPDPGYQWESDKFTDRHHKLEPRGGQKAVKPILTGMITPKPLPATSPAKKTSPLPEEKLTVSSVQDLVIEEPRNQRELKQFPAESQQPTQERRRSISSRPIVKKEKKERACAKKEDSIERLLPDLPPEVKKIQSWIYSKEDFTAREETEEEEEKPAVVVTNIPSFSTDLNPELIEEEKKKAKETRRQSVITGLIKAESQKAKWRKPELDKSYEDELRRQELAEERRKRQMEMLERIRNRKMDELALQEDDGSPHFEDYGFLSKYCIFTKGNIEMYRHAFDAVDDAGKGWLEGEDVMIALRGVNSRLTEAEEEYLYRVLELTGYKLTSGADFKMFSVLAALSQRIVKLDEWMRNLIGKMDFKMLEMKMFMCKTLWECNVDPETNKISLDQLCVDLRAGGVSFEHELEVREKLAHLDALDLLDFLTYIPLFIMIHEAVVKNPLDDTREK